MSTAEADVDFPVDKEPLAGRAKSLDQFFESTLMLGRILEPGQEIEDLAEVAAMVKAASNGGQIGEAHRDVLRLLLDDGSPFVLG